jgi:nitrogen fixation protein NifU and related proteins
MDIYSEIILDYYKNPRNKGQIDKPDFSATEVNTLCGDKLTIHLTLDKKGEISKAMFSGEGCAISQASASMLTEKLIGKTIKQAQALKEKDIIKMLNIPISPGRTKCALLCLQTIKKALGK